MAVRPNDPLRSLDWDEPIHADGDLTLRAVATILARYRVGAVLVSRRTGEPGMAGERDIVAAVAAGIDLDDACASNVASRDLITADIDTTILDASRQLLDEGVRHVAVTDRDDIVTVLSMRDLLAVLVDALDERAV
jgi:predicted transcriptional regulator